MPYCKKCENAGRGKVKLMRMTRRLEKPGYYWMCPVCGAETR